MICLQNLFWFFELRSFQMFVFLVYVVKYSMNTPVKADSFTRSAGIRSTGVLSEDQFTCSICLEVFLEPVSTPCGHSFCKACLQGYWNHSKKFLCPMCKKAYNRKPEMSVNRVLAEICSQFQGLTVASGSGTSPSQKGSINAGSDGGHPDLAGLDTGEFAQPGEVPCDACIGRKLKALKSCVNCAGSFCDSHLRHHKKVKTLMSHRLIEPTFNLAEKICKKHERLLDVYCRTDHICICSACAEASHKSHDITSIDHEYKKKTNNLGKKRSELKHLIKERSKKLEEIKQSIKVIKAGAQKELEDSWQVYAELQRLVEQSQAELVELIAMRQREAERHAQELARGLENELSQLKRRSQELEAHAHTKDKVVFLQNITTLSPSPEHTDWSSVSINTDLYLGTIRTSVSSLVDKFQEELKLLYGKEPPEVQNYAGEVILDPITAQKTWWCQRTVSRSNTRSARFPTPTGPSASAGTLHPGSGGLQLGAPLLGGGRGTQDRLDPRRGPGLGTPEGRDQAVSRGGATGACG
ncbi:Tripartite motif-containing protein 47 [Oryzias melastigma]|uniref:Tripartite motif-containing protein 47 n=1 Tax=Oryzias melastigma TaxID=30732 RepID=A0A834BRH5_ORYME|nr:Tripartite motif-containing protein 47 [Oryzias melastigma]